MAAISNLLPDFPISDAYSPAWEFPVPAELADPLPPPPRIVRFPDLLAAYALPPLNAPAILSTISIVQTADAPCEYVETTLIPGPRTHRSSYGGGPYTPTMQVPAIRTFVHTMSDMKGVIRTHKLIPAILPSVAALTTTRTPIMYAALNRDEAITALMAVRFAFAVAINTIHALRLRFATERWMAAVTTDGMA